MNALTAPEKKLLLALALLQFVHIVDFMLVMPLGPNLMHDFGIGPDHFSWIVSAYSVSGGVVGLLAAGFLDRFNRRTALLIAYSGFVLGTAACAVAPSFPMLLLARATAGVFGGVLGAMVYTIIGDVVPMVRRGTAMGLVMAAFSLASIVGVPSGLAIANLWGWRAAFGVLAVVCIPGGFFAASVVPALRDHILAAGERRPIGPVLAYELLRDEPGARYALVLMVCLMLGQFTVISFVSPAMVANGVLTREQLPLMYLLGGAFTTVSNPYIGRLADRRGAYRVFRVMAVAAMLSLMLTTLTLPLPLPLVLGVSTLFFVTVSGRMGPAITLITGSVAPKRRGALMVLNTSVQQLASGFAAFLAGQIVVQGAGGRLERYPLVGLLAMAFSILAILVEGQLQPKA